MMGSKDAFLLSDTTFDSISKAGEKTTRLLAYLLGFLLVAAMSIFY